MSDEAAAPARKRWMSVLLLALGAVGGYVFGDIKDSIGQFEQDASKCSAAISDLDNSKLALVGSRVMAIRAQTNADYAEFYAWNCDLGVVDRICPRENDPQWMHKDAIQNLGSASYAISTCVENASNGQPCTAGQLRALSLAAHEASSTLIDDAREIQEWNLVQKLWKATERAF